MDKDGYLANRSSQDYFNDLATGTQGRIVSRSELLDTLSKQLNDIFNADKDESTDNCKQRNDKQSS